MDISIRDFAIQKATKLEVAAIVNEPQILANLGIKDSSAILSDGQQYHIIKYTPKRGGKKFKALFSFESSGEGTNLYEVHTAIPKDSLKVCRLLILAAMHWGFTKGIPDAKGFITSVPKSLPKIANFCLKLGYKQIVNKPSDTSLYFIMTKKASLGETS